MRTVESLPPEAPIATLSPGLKRLLEVMVWCTSDSRVWKKQALQRVWLFFGLRIAPLAVRHNSQVTIAKAI